MYHYEDQDNWTIVSGQQQSPINIDTQHTTTLLDRPNFKSYQISTIKNLDYKLSLSGQGQSTLQHREAQFKELHFHHPSEHQLDGQNTALEAHFVHEFADNQKAVVAILFQLGAENPALVQLLDAVPGIKKTATTSVTVTDWFKNTAYYHYIGSLTTPPIVEGIEWYIAVTPQTLSKTQLQQFESFFKPNNRNIQPLNQRSVFYLD